MSAAGDRYDRERAFHDDRYTDESRKATSKYYAVDTGQARYRTMVFGGLRSDGTRVLEYGCGRGSLGFELAERGATVDGIDISPVAIDTATTEARRRGVAAHFHVMNAESLEFEDGTFDVVCGSGILHHLDLSAAVPEIRRVLRSGGVAVFYEPLGTNPLINLYRRLTPSMRTPDEHPLVPADFAAIRSQFGAVDVEYHNLLAVAGAFVRRVPIFGTPVTGLLQRADRWLFGRFAWARRLAWVAVLRARV